MGLEDGVEAMTQLAQTQNVLFAQLLMVQLLFPVTAHTLHGEHTRAKRKSNSVGKSLRPDELRTFIVGV
jgi:hypothetical protein